MAGPNPDCEECKVEGKASDVFRVSQRFIAPLPDPFTDAGGNYHWHDSSIVEQWFKCTNHHTFKYMRDPRPCPSCMFHWRDNKDDGI